MPQNSQNISGKVRTTLNTYSPKEIIKYLDYSSRGLGVPDKTPKIEFVSSDIYRFGYALQPDSSKNSVEEVITNIQDHINQLEDQKQLLSISYLSILKPNHDELTAYSDVWLNEVGTGLSQLIEGVPMLNLVNKIPSLSFDEEKYLQDAFTDLYQQTLSDIKDLEDFVRELKEERYPHYFPTEEQIEEQRVAEVMDVVHQESNIKLKTMIESGNSLLLPHVNVPSERDDPTRLENLYTVLAALGYTNGLPENTDNLKYEDLIPAVKHAQRDLGLDDDGWVGDSTQNALLTKIGVLTRTNEEHVAAYNQAVSEGGSATITFSSGMIAYELRNSSDETFEQVTGQQFNDGVQVSFSDLHQIMVQEGKTTLIRAA